MRNASPKTAPKLFAWEEGVFLALSTNTVRHSTGRVILVSASKVLNDLFDSHTQDFQAAFGDTVTLIVIGVSGVFLVSLFILALSLWRLFERADKMRELKNLYQDSMRAARDGIELLLKTGYHPLSLY